MVLSSEVFVLAIFISAVFLYPKLLADSDLPGGRLFFSALVFFLSSNISTILEDFFYYEFFNFIEHFCIAMGCVLLSGGVIKFCLHHSEEKPRDKFQ